MQNLPHSYTVGATAAIEKNVSLSSEGLTPIDSAPPTEFGGPGGFWSPETLLVAAVADCFILTFKAIARASKCNWVSISCNVDGTLDQVDKVTRFTEFRLQVVLDVPAGTDEQKSLRLLEKAERACLITNSLSAKAYLAAEVHSAIPVST